MTVFSFRQRQTEQLVAYDRINPPLAAWLRELDALYLFGTIGFDAVMRADGSVLVCADNFDSPSSDDAEYRIATATERSLSIAAASERWPELAELLPPRPDRAKDCPVCVGQGSLAVTNTRILCQDCGALGWIMEPAA